MTGSMELVTMINCMEKQEMTISMDMKMTTTCMEEMVMTPSSWDMATMR